MRHITPASGGAPTPPAAAMALFRQLAALMRLDGLARRDSKLEFFLQEACRSAAEGVDAGFAGVLQYRADEQAFLLQAGVGMQARLIGRARATADLDTTAGLAWHTDQMVHFRHLAAGCRIRTWDAATEYSIGRLVSVPVRGEGEQAFGVLEVGSAAAGEFAQGDLVFLQAVADCIGAAVARHADRASRADRAALVAERRRAVREPQLGDAWRPDVPAGPDGHRGTWSDGDASGFPAAQTPARDQAPSFGGLQQDAQVQDGSG